MNNQLDPDKLTITRDRLNTLLSDFKRGRYETGHAISMVLEKVAFLYDQPTHPVDQVLPNGDILSIGGKPILRKLRESILAIAEEAHPVKRLACHQAHAECDIYHVGDHSRQYIVVDAVRLEQLFAAHLQAAVPQWHSLKDSYPPYNELVVCRFEYFNETFEPSYAVLKHVDEDDVCWRTADDDSEFNEMAATVTHWQKLQQFNQGDGNET